MNSSLIALLVSLLFVALLIGGRLQLAKGANAHVANGAVLLALAVVLGLVAAGMVS